MSYVCVIYELLILLHIDSKSPFLSEDEKKATKLIASVVEILTSVICASLAAIFATKKQSVFRLLKFILWLDRNIKFKE